MGESHLSAYRVAFRGARFTRNARGALSAAEITPISDYPREELGGGSRWIPLTRQYAVTVRARSPENAIERVRGAVEAHGGYGEFTATLSE
jgi:hypothetical protein